MSKGRQAAPKAIRHPGSAAIHFGAFRAGETYEVGQTYQGQELTPELAERLVKVKGFTWVSGEPEAAGED